MRAESKLSEKCIYVVPERNLFADDAATLVVLEFNFNERKPYRMAIFAGRPTHPVGTYVRLTRYITPYTVAERFPRRAALCNLLRVSQLSAPIISPTRLAWYQHGGTDAHEHGQKAQQQVTF